MSDHFFPALVLAATVALTAPCLAETVKLHADLSPASEVPAVTDAGSGTADATLDTQTHVLTYDVTFSGFSGPVTMAHFHGPAAAGANAGVQVVLGTNPTSPIHGTATLTPDQQKQLLDGMWYANVHTAAHPKGAARGQMGIVKN
jgi:hypothetical protein